MTPILIIAILTVIVLVCTVVVVRRQSRENPQYTYLESPTWNGLSADGEVTDRCDLTAPAAVAVEAASSTVAPPEGARLRAGTSAGIGAGAAAQDEQLLEEVVRGLERVPPLPHVLYKILGELDDAGSSARSLAEIVSTEPVLTASLLRVANSAATGLRRRIISVDESVAYLGYSTVRALVLRMKLAELVPQRNKRGYDSEQLWMHSLVVSQIAAHLANRLGGGADASLVSTIGMLHDIGKLAINSLFPDVVAQLWARDTRAPADESFLARERRLFGADHAFMGGFLAAQWKLPQELIESIRLHHLCGDASAVAGMSQDLRRATQLVHVANQLAKYSHVYCADMEIDIIPEQMLVDLGLPPQMESLLNVELDDVIRRAGHVNGGSSGRA
jgi:putative nucleotidyltransferase with HDIG domain